MTSLAGARVLLSKIRFAGLLVSSLFAMLALDSPAEALVNVSQHHNHATRDGLYIDPAFTQPAAAGLKRDLGFNGRIVGNVYAQPLYIEGKLPLLIAVTEADNVYALDPATGNVIWQRNVGAPVPVASLPCGNINPLGITGTPVVDLPSRTLFFDAMTTPDNGITKRHLIFALDVDSGTNRAGWPVDVNATAKSGSLGFTSSVQNQRGALAVLGGRVYVPYGGNAGDCGNYHGWLAGVNVQNPSDVLSWATLARGGGSWAVGGVAGDGDSPFIATGNTFGTSVWGGGESIIRFQPGPVFSGAAADYWTPTNWLALDASDTDLGGSGALLVDVPGATPSQLVVALGKDGNAYLLDRGNLGGISAPLAQAHISSSTIIQAAATYRTPQGTYVVCCANTTQLIAFRIEPASPPKITVAWSRDQGGRGSPFVTSTDGTNGVVVWGIGCEGDQRLHGFNGDTGQVIYSGGGTSELMSGTRRFNTAIAARGRIYVANDNRVYAFTVSVPPVMLMNALINSAGNFQFSFTNMPGLSFTAFGSSDLSLPLANWASQGSIPEVAPGGFEFTDPVATNNGQRFYRVRSP